jgi:hypothetical protein
MNTLLVECTVCGRYGLFFVFMSRPKKFIDILQTGLRHVGTKIRILLLEDFFNRFSRNMA